MACYNLVGFHNFPLLQIFICLSSRPPLQLQASITTITPPYHTFVTTINNFLIFHDYPSSGQRINDHNLKLSRFLLNPQWFSQRWIIFLMHCLISCSVTCNVTRSNPGTILNYFHTNFLPNAQQHQPMQNLTSWDFITTNKIHWADLMQLTDEKIRKRSSITGTV